MKLFTCLFAVQCFASQYTLKNFKLTYYFAKLHIQPVHLIMNLQFKLPELKNSRISLSKLLYGKLYEKLSTGKKCHVAYMYVSNYLPLKNFFQN